MSSLLNLVEQVHCVFRPFIAGYHYEDAEFTNTDFPYTGPTFTSETGVVVQIS